MSLAHTFLISPWFPTELCWWDGGDSSMVYYWVYWQFSSFQVLHVEHFWDGSSIWIVVELEIVLRVVGISCILGHISPTLRLSYPHYIQLGSIRDTFLLLRLSDLLSFWVVLLRFDLEYFPWDMIDLSFWFLSGSSLSLSHLWLPQFLQEYFEPVSCAMMFMLFSRRINLVFLIYRSS